MELVDVAERLGDVYIPPDKAHSIAVVCTSGSCFLNEPLKGQFLCSIVLSPHVNSNIFFKAVADSSSLISRFMITQWNINYALYCR